MPTASKVPRKSSSSVAIQELQSPTGIRHSDAIQNTEGNRLEENGLGFVWFDNDLVKPQFGASMGDQTGATLYPSFVSMEKAAEYLPATSTLMSMNKLVALDASRPRLCLILPPFPMPILGPGDFLGIRGSGCTQAVENPPEGVATTSVTTLLEEPSMSIVLAMPWPTWISVPSWPASEKRFLSSAQRRDLPWTFDGCCVGRQCSEIRT